MNITFLFKHACRLLSRMRPYTFINVLGLVVSLTGAIIIARYVHQELTVDHYIPLLDRTFMLTNVHDDGTLHTEGVNYNHIENWEDPMADSAVECFTRFTCIYNGMGVTSDGHFPAQLSGGQQQRVAIARAVISNPKLILADEPTGNLDIINGREVMELLKELHQEGATIVMVTHSQHDANYADRIINLFDGQIVNEVEM